MRKTILQEGIRFGNWVTISFHDKYETGNIAKWKCRCDCGTISLVKTSDLVNKSTSKCKRCSNKNNTTWKELPNQKSCRNNILISIKKSASSRKLNFNLSDEEILNLVFQRCFYCDREPSNIIRSKNSTLSYNGLDRVNNNEGYTKDNVVTCCKYCNSSKMSLSINEWLLNMENILTNKNKILKCSETISKESTN